MLMSASICFADNYREVFKDEYLSDISPNGEWAAGAIDDGSVVIRNLVNNQNFESRTNGATVFYYIGSGPQPISNTGIVVGSTNGDNAAYWENGTWHTLKTPNPEFMSNASSITPDGSVICGGAGNDNMSLETDKIMLVPAVWYRQADGSYSDAVLLPHPDLDYTGRVPQYITALAISDDGKTVAGQIRDYVGFMHEPILYTCDDNGEWSYTMLYPELLNPDNVVFPAYPGEYNGIPMPTPEWFMTEEELEEFSQALDRWTTGKPTPEYKDYMTKEEIEAYNKALDEFLDEYNPWAESFDTFNELYTATVEAGYSFVFNNVTLTPDGKYFGTTREISYVEDPIEGPKSRMYPVVLNTDGSGYTDLNGNPELSLLTSSMARDGQVMATYIDPENILPRRAYVFPKDSKEAEPIEVYFMDVNPELSMWLEDEMTREVIVGFLPGGEFDYQDFMCSGAPITTPDMSRMICVTMATDTWVDAEALYYSYIFDTGIDISEVKPLATASCAMEILAGGVIDLKGEFSMIEVYDVSGALIYSEKSPAGNVNPNLAKGIYVIKALGADGTEIVKKVAL